MDLSQKKEANRKVKRASKTEEEKKERLIRRNSLDRARRAAESEQQKVERLRKRRERERVRRAEKKAQIERKELKSVSPSRPGVRVAIYFLFECNTYNL